MKQGRSKLPLPMVERYPMFQSLSNRNSLIEGLEKPEVRMISMIDK